jgi:hypothetical protein
LLFSRSPVDAKYEPSEGSCVAAAWLGHWAYTLAYGVLFLKVWRVNRIFRQRKMTVVKHTDGDLLRWVASALGLVTIYLIIWTAVGQPKPTLKLVSNTIYSICESSSDAWPNAIIAIEGVVLAFGVILCVQQRNFPDLFNESSTLAATLYNTIVLGSLAIGISKGLLQDAPAVALFQELAVLLCINVMVLAIFVPKLLFVYRGEGPSSVKYNNTHAGTVMGSALQDSSEKAASNGKPKSPTNAGSKGSKKTGGTASGQTTAPNTVLNLKSRASFDPNITQMNEHSAAADRGQMMSLEGSIAPVGNEITTAIALPGAIPAQSEDEGGAQE